MSTTNTLEGKTFTVVGRMRYHATTAALGAELEELGARVTYSLGSGTDYLIAGDQCGYQVERANMRGTPVVTESQAEELLKGKLDLSGLDDAIAASKKSAPSASANEVVEKLRPLLNAEETPRWWSVVSAFEGADEAAERVAVDYAAHRLGELPLSFSGYNWMSQCAGGFDGALPKAWKPDVLAGVDSPKLSLVRLLSFHDDKLGNAQLSKVFDCPSLDGVVFLDVGRNKVGSSFFKKLVKSGQFDSLRILSVENVRVKKGLAKAIAGTLALPNLFTLDLDESRVDADGMDELVSALAKANLRAFRLSNYHVAFEERHLRELFAEEATANLEYVRIGERIDSPAMLDIVEERGTLAEGEEPIHIDLSGVRMDTTQTFSDYSDQMQEAAEQRFGQPMKLQLHFERYGDTAPDSEHHLYRL